MEQVKNKFFVCWEQFKKIGGAYQHDGFDNWRLVSYFYERIVSPNEAIIMSKSSNEVLQFLDYKADMLRSWEHLVTRSYFERQALMVSSNCLMG